MNDCQKVSKFEFFYVKSHPNLFVFKKIVLGFNPKSFVSVRNVLSKYIHFQKFKHFTHDFSNQENCQRAVGRSKNLWRAEGA